MPDITPESVETSATVQKLHRRTPYMILEVMQTQFSIARHYGGCTYNGEKYAYQPDTDSLVRRDVVRALAPRRSMRQTMRKTKGHK